MLGVALVLENMALLVFGPEPAAGALAAGAPHLWLGPLFVDVARLVTFAVAVVLTLALSLFLYRTDLGRLIRAAADNHYGALVIGADVRRVYATAFGIGAACVGAAGALVSPILPFQPPAGLSLSVTSFNIVIIGGMGSLVGAFIGGLLVSVAESLGAVFLRPSLKELVSFSLLIVILLFRPAGLFGKRAVMKWAIGAGGGRAAAALPAVLERLRRHHLHADLLLRVPGPGLEHRGRLRRPALGRPRGLRRHRRLHFRTPLR